LSHQIRTNRAIAAHDEPSFFAGLENSLMRSVLQLKYSIFPPHLPSTRLTELSDAFQEMGPFVRCLTSHGFLRQSLGQGVGLPVLQERSRGSRPRWARWRGVPAGIVRKSGPISPPCDVAFRRSPPMTRPTTKPCCRIARLRLTPNTCSRNAKKNPAKVSGVAVNAAARRATTASQVNATF
jgi:hypothetical protein